MNPNENNYERAKLAKTNFHLATTINDLRQVCKDMPHLCLNEKSILHGMIKSGSVNSYERG